MGLTSLAAACSGNKTIEKDGVINVATHMQHLNQLCLEDIQSKEVISVPLKSGQININQTIPEKGKN